MHMEVSSPQPRAIRHVPSFGSIGRRIVGRPAFGGGFTLIELLVVIAVIALLIGILLPSLGAARQTARTIKCAAGQRSVAQAVAVYQTNSRYFPAHYVYGYRNEGTEWRFEDQITTNPNPGNGYVHWSYALFSDGSAAEDAFKCPTVPNGGAPATNPGSNPRDWELDQLNDLGGGVGAATPNDRQVKRTAYAGNGAIFPRNKFFDSPGQRKNRFVKDSDIEFGDRTVLLTEFLSRPNWTSLRVSGVIKSHRPITPFVGVGSGGDVYSQTNSSGPIAPFRYSAENEIMADDQTIPDGVIDDADAPMNAVGRHHPGKGSKGGTTNFAFIDGHVEQSTILKTVQDRKWGEKFYSLTGDIRVKKD